MKARSPGKIVLSGSYAVLFDAPALVMAVNQYVFADSNQEASLITEEVNEALRKGLLKRPPWFDSSTLRLQNANGSSTKMGLGSSAAILLASLAVSGQFKLPEQKKELFLEARHIHQTVQNGGSGIDIAASTFGGVLQYKWKKEPVIETVILPKDLCIEVFASRNPASTTELIKKVNDLEKKRKIHF